MYARTGEDENDVGLVSEGGMRFGRCGVRARRWGGSRPGGWGEAGATSGSVIAACAFGSGPVVVVAKVTCPSSTAASCFNVTLDFGVHNSVSYSVGGSE